MSRPRNAVPSYRLHKPTGQAVCTVYTADGLPRDEYLGPHGSPESRAAYARLCAALRPGNVYLGETPDTTVAELALAYWAYARGYHGDAGERRAIQGALRLLRETHGDTPAAAFGPLALRAVRDAMVRTGWARTYCNAQVRRLVRAFKWGASEELVPAGVFQGLKTLAPLRAGKTDARETEPRLPADPAAVEKTLPFLPPHARALVELLRATGMRPGEACRLRLGEIDRTGAVWVYAPEKHKTAHRGKARAVALGAAAQAVIVAHLGGRTLGPAEYVFSPARAREERYAALRAKRKSKVPPSQANRRKAGGKRLPGERYTPTALAHAVAKACRAAGVAPWTPHQVRHLVAARLRGEGFSLEHVRAALGHSHASMTAHYAKGADLKLAAEVAARAG